MSSGKRVVCDDFSQKPTPPSPATGKKPKAEADPRVPNDVYLCMRDGVPAGLMYLNVKAGKFVTDDAGPEIAMAVTQKLPIGDAEWQGSRKQEDRRGQEYTLPGQLKIKFKTRVGFDTAKDIVATILGKELAPTKGPVDQILTPSFTVERRPAAMALAVTGDTYDVDDWFSSKLSGKWSSEEKAVMIPVESDEDAEIAMTNLRNLCQYLGYGLIENWFRAAGPPRRSRARWETKQTDAHG